MNAKRYTWSNTPDLVPVDWSDEWMGDDLCKAAGLDPDDPEVSFGVLSEDWNGHSAGSIVVSELTVEGHRFAVLGTA